MDDKAGRQAYRAGIVTRRPKYWKRHSQFAFLLIAMALAVRAIIPAGYMPGEGRKSLTVYICTGVDGTGKMETISLGTSKPANDHDEDRPQACSFAGIAGVADLPAAVQVDFHAHQETAPDELSPLLFPGRGLAAPPPPATGPPFLS